MKMNLREKQELERYMDILALVDANKIEAAIEAFGMSNLTAEQLRFGSVARLTSAYKFFRSYGPRRRAPRQLLTAAYNTLIKAGVADLAEP